jgi:hypothetical protein
MRLLTIGVLLLAAATSACEHGATASTGSSAPAAASETAPHAKETPRAAASLAAATDSAAANTAAREVRLPAGTTLPIVLDTSVGSDTSRVEQPVRAHLARPVIVHGEQVLPAGAEVSGVVTDAVRSGKVKGVAHVGMRFDTLAHGGESYRIHTTTIGRAAPSSKKKDALEIGAPAVGGAIIGALVGGKKGAAVGTVAGGGAGTAVVLSTRGKEVHVPKGSALTLRLAEPVTVHVRG